MNRAVWGLALVLFMALACASAPPISNEDGDVRASSILVSDGAARFDALLQTHGRFYTKLLKEREAPPLAYERARKDAQKIRTLSDLTGMLGTDYPTGTAVLVYHLPEALSAPHIDASCSEGDYEQALHCMREKGLLIAKNIEALLIDKTGLVAAARLPVDADQIDDLCATLRAMVTANRTRGLRTARPLMLEALKVDASTPLADALLPEPIKSALKNVRHLVIVPIKGIGMVPFAALEPWKAGHPLIERMSISVAPGLHTLATQTEPWEPALKSPLMVGNPTNTGMAPLPGAEMETAQVADQLGHPALLGAAATRKAVDARIATADMIYFATHGKADPDNPLDSGALVLADGDLLTARAIQKMTLKAQIAVLSACETGLGMAHEGGTIGLSRAFHIAGVPRVVMSLWRVEDAATQALMIEFMAQLEHHAPAEALRLAMLTLRKTHPEAMAWASFTLFGTPR